MQAKRADGFTIIELMLSLAFISVMLIFVMTTVVQVMRSYNKGLTTKQMNQTARSITEDMTRTARSAWAESVVDATADGRLCVGGVSYVWNEPAIAGGIAGNQFADGSAVDIVRVNDPTRQQCSAPYPTVPNPATNDTVSVLSNGTVRILDLAVNQSSDQRLLGLAFSITSVGADVPVLLDGRYQCPTDSAALFGTFCAIADFETTLYLRNKNGG